MRLTAARAVGRTVKVRWSKAFRSGSLAESEYVQSLIFRLAAEGAPDIMRVIGQDGPDWSLNGKSRTLHLRKARLMLSRLDRNRNDI